MSGPRSARATGGTIGIAVGIPDQIEPRAGPKLDECQWPPVCTGGDNSKGGQQGSATAHLVGLHTMRRHDVPDRISILAPECVEIGIGSLRRAGPGCETRIEIAEWMGGTSQQEDMHRTQQEVRKLLVWVEATEQPGALPDP